MSQEQKKEFTGAWMPRHIMEDEELTMTEKMIYMEINCFEVCYRSNKSLGERYKLKANTISLVVSKLIKLGYVVSNQKTGGYRNLQAMKDARNQRGSLKETKESHLTESKRLVDNNQTIDSSKNIKDNNTTMSVASDQSSNSFQPVKLTKSHKKEKSDKDIELEIMIRDAIKILNEVFEHYTNIEPYVYVKSKGSQHPDNLNYYALKWIIVKAYEGAINDAVSFISDCFEEVLSGTEESKFCPTFTTPLEFKSKLVKLEAYFNRKPKY